MGAHILLVGNDNFAVCVERGVYGCVMPNTEWNRAEVVAGILGLQPDDLVFFYVKNKGVYGVWKVAGEPYYDETKIWSDTEQLYPYRFSFEPALGYFPTPVSLSDILDLRDKGRIWTFDLNPVQQKNQYKITTEEARELLRLLLRNNPIRENPRPISARYAPESPRVIDIMLSSKHGERVGYEGWLNAWFMRSLAGGKLRDKFGDCREFLNLVPTTFNKVMDIFLTHVTTVDSVDVTYKYTCIELKTDRATEKDLTQLLRYEDWLARRIGSGDKEMVQSVLVANRFARPVVEYVKNRERIEEKTVRLIRYRVTDDAQDVILEEVMAT